VNDVRALRVIARAGQHPPGLGCAGGDVGMSKPTELPEGWKSVRLGTVGTLINGDRGKNYPSQKDFVDDGIPFINAGHIQNGEIDCSSMNFISRERFNLLGSGKVKPNDILYCLRGSLGKTAVVQDIAEGAIASSLVIIRPSEEITTDYLYRFLASPLGQAEVFKYDNGSSQPNLSAKSVKEYELPLPPLSEQRRIAAILDKADAIRRKRKQAIQYTEELLRATFLDMFGDPVTNPKGWDSIDFSKIIQGDMSNGLSPSNSGTYSGSVLTLSAVTQGYFNESENKCAKFDVPPTKSKMVCDDHLLICRGNGNIKLVGCGRFSSKNYDSLMFPDTIIAAPIKFSIIRKAYLEFLWNGVSVRSQIERQARTTNGTYKINQSILRKISILLPPMELQKKFEELAYKVRSTVVKFQSTNIDDLFNSLLQRAFHGEL
jgi:type I restriction enzyme S subunit